VLITDRQTDRQIWVNIYKIVNVCHLRDYIRSNIQSFIYCSKVYLIWNLFTSFIFKMTESFIKSFKSNFRWGLISVLFQWRCKFSLTINIVIPQTSKLKIWVSAYLSVLFFYHKWMTHLTKHILCVFCFIEWDIKDNGYWGHISTNVSPIVIKFRYHILTEFNLTSTSH